MKTATYEYINEVLWLYFNKTLLQLLVIDLFGQQICNICPRVRKYEPVQESGGIQV